MRLLGKEEGDFSLTQVRKGGEGKTLHAPCTPCICPVCSSYLLVRLGYLRPPMPCRPTPRTTWGNSRRRSHTSSLQRVRSLVSACIPSPSTNQPPARPDPIHNTQPGSPRVLPSVCTRASRGGVLYKAIHKTQNQERRTRRASLLFSQMFSPLVHVMLEEDDAGPIRVGRLWVGLQPNTRAGSHAVTRICLQSYASTEPESFDTTQCWGQTAGIWADRENHERNQKKRRRHRSRHTPLSTFPPPLLLQRSGP